MTTLNIPQFSAQDTPRVFGPTSLTAGLSSLTLTLDVSQMAAGQVLWMLIQFGDPNNWFGSAEADFDGPYIDKHTGQLVNTNALMMGFGSVGDQPVLSQPGWRIQATVWSVNGPITIPGGTLVAS